MQWYKLREANCSSEDISQSQLKRVEIPPRNLDSQELKTPHPSVVKSVSSTHLGAEVRPSNEIPLLECQSDAPSIGRMPLTPKVYSTRSNSTCRQNSR